MKTLSFFYCILTALALTSQNNLDSSLVACYSMNGHGADAISALNATLVNVSPANNRFNQANACLSFTCSASAYMQVPDNALLKPQQLSFSAWIKPTASFSNKGYILFTSKNGTVAPAYAATIETASIGKVIKVYKALSSGLAIAQSTIAISSNNWWHFGFSIDNNQIKLFVNGVLQPTVSAAGPISYLAGKMIYVGASNEPGDNEPFCGSIDNVRFYNRVLSANEFSQLYTVDPACITATAAPVAAFTVNPPSCVGQPMVVANLSTNYPDFYFWQIQGAQMSNPMEANPIITFSTAGVYTAVVTVSNAIGSSSVTGAFTVNPSPIVTAMSNRTITCRGLGANLTAMGAQSYTWLPAQVTPTLFVDPQSNTVFSVSGTDSLGCIGTSTIMIRVVTDCYNSIQEQDMNNHFIIFPNPASSYVLIKADLTTEVKICLHNAQGKMVCQFFTDGPESRLDLEQMPAGLYFLSLEMNDQKILKKFVKE